MTVTVAWWVPYVVVALAAVIGFLAATFAYLTSPRPGQDQSPPRLEPELRSPLPRPGYLILQPVERVWPEPFPTEPMSLASEHHAQLARTELEIRQLIADYGG